MRSLSTIAYEIFKDWKKIHFAAKPYLYAMASLDNINQQYGYDSGYSIVSYFLCNAVTWHGPVAKRIKAELRDMLRENSK